MKNIKIRKYQESDCNTLIKLFYDTVHTINAKDYTNEQLNAWTSNLDYVKWNHSFLTSNTLIAKLNNEIVGFANMDDKGYLDKLFVHKNYQKLGIASTLVKELELNALKKGVYKFETYASITAKDFFIKQGYKVIKENQVVRKGIRLINYKMIKEIKVMKEEFNLSLKAKEVLSQINDKTKLGDIRKLQKKLK